MNTMNGIIENQNIDLPKVEYYMSYISTIITVLSKSDITLGNEAQNFIIDRDLISKLINYFNTKCGPGEFKIDPNDIDKYISRPGIPLNNSCIASFETINTDINSAFTVLINILSMIQEYNDMYTPHMQEIVNVIGNYVINNYNIYCDANERAKILDNGTIVIVPGQGFNTITLTTPSKTIANPLSSGLNTISTELDSAYGLVFAKNLPPEFSFTPSVTNDTLNIPDVNPNELSPSDIQSIENYCDVRCEYKGYSSVEKRTEVVNGESVPFKITQRLTKLDYYMYFFNDQLANILQLSGDMSGLKFSGTWSAVIKVNQVPLENCNEIEFPFIIITQKQPAPKKNDPMAESVKSKRFFINLCSSQAVINKLVNEPMLPTRLTSKCTSGLTKAGTFDDNFMINPMEFNGFGVQQIASAFNNIVEIINQIIIVDEHSGRISYPSISLDPTALLEPTLYYRTNSNKKLYEKHIIEDARLCIPLLPNGINTKFKGQAKTSAKTSKDSKIKPLFLTEKNNKEVEEYVNKLVGQATELQGKFIPKYVKNWRSIIANLYNYLLVVDRNQYIAGNHATPPLYGLKCETIVQIVLMGDGEKAAYQQYIDNVNGLIDKMTADPNNMLYTSKIEAGTVASNKCKLSYIDSARILKKVLTDGYLLQLLLECNTEVIYKTYEAQFNAWISHPKTVELIAYCATPLLYSVSPVFAFTEQMNSTCITSGNGISTKYVELFNDLNKCLMTNESTRIGMIGIGAHSSYRAVMSNDHARIIDLMISNLIFGCRSIDGSNNIKKTAANAFSELGPLQAPGFNAKPAMFLQSQRGRKFI